MKLAHMRCQSMLVALLLLVISQRVARASLYQIDDGTAETTFSLPFTNFDLIALNQFNVINGNNMLGAVEIAWGTPNHPDPFLNGLSYTVAIWNDPDGDGNPSDASLVFTLNNVITNASTNTFELTTLPTCIAVTQSFFVGFLITIPDPHGSQPASPAGLDSTAPLLGRSWLTGNFPGGSGDLGNLTNNALPLDKLENYGPLSNFMIRADICVPEPSTYALLVAGLLLSGQQLYRRRRAA